MPLRRSRQHKLDLGPQSRLVLLTYTHTHTMIYTVHTLSRTTVHGTAALYKGVQGVYRLTNTVNGKEYVGSSVDIGRRLAEYGNTLRAQRELARGESIIASALLKYGIEAFTFELLMVYTPVLVLSASANVQALRALETSFIESLSPEYNILRRTNNETPMPSRPKSPDTRARISAGQKARAEAERDAGISRSPSIETRALISQNSTSTKSVDARSAATGEVTWHASIKLAAESTGVNRYSLVRAIKSGLERDGWYFTWGAPKTKP